MSKWRNTLDWIILLLVSTLLATALLIGVKVLFDFAGEHIGCQDWRTAEDGELYCND